MNDWNKKYILVGQIVFLVSTNVLYLSVDGGKVHAPHSSFYPDDFILHEEKITP